MSQRNSRLFGRGSQLFAAAVLLAWLLALAPSAALATYTGVQDTTTIGTVAGAGGWIVVPEHEHSYDPGTIDGSPSDNNTSSLEIARASGSRFISFRSVSPRYSLTTGPMLVAGARNVLAVAWADTAGAGQIDSATLNANGNLPGPATQPGAPTGDSLRLAAGPDGAYAVSWSDATGAHALAAAAGAKGLSALLGPDVALGGADQVVLSGGDSLWLVNDAGGGLSTAPAVFGQDTAPHALTLAGALEATALGDDAGGLWVLARDRSGWFAAHADRAGRLSSTRLPAAATGAEIALAGTTAVVAYRAGVHCASYLARIRPAAAPRSLSGARNITPRGAACWTPQGIAVDPASATAYVLLQSRRGTTLTVETAARSTSSWHGSLSEGIDAIVAVGSNRVVLESHRPQRNIGEQCGGANPSFSQPYFIRVFRRSRLERSGRLDASVMNC